MGDKIFEIPSSYRICGHHLFSSVFSKNNVTTKVRNQGSPFMKNMSSTEVKNTEISRNGNEDRRQKTGGGFLNLLLILMFINQNAISRI